MQFEACNLKPTVFSINGINLIFFEGCLCGFLKIQSGMLFDSCRVLKWRGFPFYRRILFVNVDCAVLIDNCTGLSINGAFFHNN